MVKILIPTSAISSINKIFRLRCTIKARITKLLKYFKYAMNSDPDFLDILDQNIGLLEELINDLDVLYNAIITKAVVSRSYSEIRDAWKAWPNYEEHCIRIFGSFKKMPKYDFKLRLKMLLRQRDYVSSKNEDTSHLNGLIAQEQFICDFLEKLVKKMIIGSKEGRKSEILRRLSLEVELRASEGWFFVFNTLTVNSWSMNKVFPDKGSSGLSYWQKYVRDIDGCFARASYGSVRKAKGHDYHKYFAVVERGSETGRLHIHVLHIFKSLPIWCVDRNNGVTVPYYREIDYFKRFWPYGNSSPVACRFSAFDSFTALGWRWPVKCKTCKRKCQCHGQIQYIPVIPKPPIALVTYMGKYLTKAYGVHEKEVGCIWRTRLSRTLGSRPIKKVLNQMPLKTRLCLLEHPKLKLTLGLTRIPRMMLRRLLVGTLCARTLLHLFQRSLRYPPSNLLKRWQSMIRGIPVSSRLNVGNLRMRSSQIMDVFKYFQKGTYKYSIGGATYAI